MALTVAALQTSPQASMAAALDETLSLATEAIKAGAMFLGTPEYCGGCISTLVPPHALEEDHAYLSGVKKFAASNNVWFLVGSVAITGTEGRIFNRGFLVDDVGQVRSRYSKIHLYDIVLSETKVYRESAAVEPGSEAVLIDTPVGKIGHTICYDLRFPHLYRELSQAGAEILAVPSVFPKLSGEMRWHVLNRARAIENGAFVFAPCSVGDIPGGGTAYGHSLIIDPWGKILAEGDESPCVVLADIDLSQVNKARASIPAVNYDREFSIHTSQAPEVE